MYRWHAKGVVHLEHGVHACKTEDSSWAHLEIWFHNTNPYKKTLCSRKTYSNSFDSERTTRLDDTTRDLTTIGNQHGVEGAWQVYKHWMQNQPAVPLRTEHCATENAQNKPSNLKKDKACAFAECTLCLLYSSNRVALHWLNYNSQRINRLASLEPDKNELKWRFVTYNTDSSIRS